MNRKLGSRGGNLCAIYKCDVVSILSKNSNMTDVQPRASFSMGMDPLHFILERHDYSFVLARTQATAPLCLLSEDRLRNVVMPWWRDRMQSDVRERRVSNPQDTISTQARVVLRFHHVHQV